MTASGASARPARSLGGRAPYAQLGDGGTRWVSEDRADTLAALLLVPPSPSRAGKGTGGDHPASAARSLQIRKILGITFCRECAVDTMPNERTGRCFWCDTKIAKIVRAAPKPVGDPPEMVDGGCRLCGEPLVQKRGNPRKYCSERCKRSFWQRYSERGRANVAKWNALRDRGKAAA